MFTAFESVIIILITSIEIKAQVIVATLGDKKREIVA